MEYREIEAISIDEAKLKIKKEYGDRARIIKVVESSKGGFFGVGKKKFVRVLISVSDMDLLKKYKENMGIKNIHEKKNKLLKENSERYTNESLSMSLVMEKLNNIENEIQKNGFEKTESLHSNLLEVKEILKQNDFFDDFIDRLIENIRDNLSYSKIDDKIEVHKFVYDYIKKRLIISEDIQLKNSNKNILILVGPTGVGKTTTIAKIAANAIREKLKVELITIDGYRIGAKYQLEKYAEYMRAPMSGVEDNLGLQKIVDLSDADLILIDTIGRSAKDEMNIVKMKQLLRFNRCDPEYVLTISASTKTSDIQRIFKNFDIFGYKSIIITKLDESDTIGSILSAAINKERGIRYYTDGQRVPNDIEKASHLNIMEKIKGLELEVYLSNVNW